MVEYTLLNLIILHIVSLVAGFFSAIAGGGGLVILPALMAAGLRRSTPWQLLKFRACCWWPLPYFWV